MSKPKTLLERYDMPLNHLDFAYIEKCRNAREIEKIVHILRSGEEGYFPDLTKCAEQKLKELKPDSKLFRYEEPIKTSQYLDPNELKPIYEWNQDIKTKETKLAELKKSSNAPISEDLLQPLRKPGKIEIDKSSTQQAGTNKKSASDESKRIKSTDYDKWDKYDPEEEILRMDLADERAKEELERENRLNLKRSAESEQAIEAAEEAFVKRDLKFIKNLSNLEREKYAEEHRLCGNEYFRSKEYESAIREYTRAIGFDPQNAARAYNNRAISYIKLKIYLSAIEDCEECLKLEPNNVKARLRLAEANYAYGRRRESYDLYLKVLELEPQHAVALKAIDELRTQYGELPPANATRLKIEDCSSKPQTEKSTEHAPKQVVINQPLNKSPTPKAQATKKPIAKEYDLAELIKPNRVIKSKLATAAEALGNITAAAKSHNKEKQQQQQIHTSTKFISTEKSPALEMRLPMITSNAGQKSKLLIEEM